MDEEEYIVSKEEFEAFVDYAISQRRERELDFDKWDANYFIEALPLRSFLNSQTQLIGKTIDAIFTMGCIFNRDGVDENDEERYLCLDEPIVI